MIYNCRLLAVGATLVLFTYALPQQPQLPPNTDGSELKELAQSAVNPGAETKPNEPFQFDCPEGEAIDSIQIKQVTVNGDTDTVYKFTTKKLTNKAITISKKRIVTRKEGCFKGEFVCGVLSKHKDTGAKKRRRFAVECCSSDHLKVTSAKSEQKTFELNDKPILINLDGSTGGLSNVIFTKSQVITFSNKFEFSESKVPEPTDQDTSYTEAVQSVRKQHQNSTSTKKDKSGGSGENVSGENKKCENGNGRCKNKNSHTGEKKSNSTSKGAKSRKGEKNHPSHERNNKQPRNESKSKFSEAELKELKQFEIQPGAESKPNKPFKFECPEGEGIESITTRKVTDKGEDDLIFIFTSKKIDKTHKFTTSKRILKGSKGISKHSCHMREYMCGIFSKKIAGKRRYAIQCCKSDNLKRSKSSQVVKKSMKITEKGDIVQAEASNLSMVNLFITKTDVVSFFNKLEFSKTKVLDSEDDKSFERNNFKSDADQSGSASSEASRP